jgi:predicted helicase
LKTRVYPDGTILHTLRVPHGYWEAKDTADDLDEEIRKKTARGYPQDNIIYENSDTAVLIQDRREVTRCLMYDPQALGQLIGLFFAWERPEIAEFRKAIRQFQADLPAVLGALRAKIDDAYAGNATFQPAAAAFLDQAKKSINPSIGEADVREMLIQHILTEEIFSHVFNAGDFHRENNVAQALYTLEAKFFTGGVKRDTLRALEPYYAAIRANAAQITAHVEKQTFLKVIYEGFYKVYNPKAADRLGVVYTPTEIVRFIVQGADWLCQHHFGKSLIDRDVEILDPATGTGTFVCELLELFRGQSQKLDHKYRNELHANEVAILPYYVANLNIEATYAAIKGEFVEFPHLCFVDTLDNTAGLGIRAGHQHDLFGAMSEENFERIRRQNGRKISIVIGNPPYNVGQLNELNDNKNRPYPTIDKYVRASYVARSEAQKTAAYDMYVRFFRWATDRLHDDGIVAFVTNRSFIEKRTFDGFRKTVVEEFQDIHLVDLGGDVRDNPKLSGTTHNVFGIQTGVAISFFVKKAGRKGCSIHYTRRPEFETAMDKLAFLGSTDPSTITYQPIRPDKDGTWLSKTSNDWDDLLPVADKATKRAKKSSQERAIFSQFSTGIMSGRDEWVYDTSPAALEAKMTYFKREFEKAVAAGKPDEKLIKWSRNLKRKLGPGSTARAPLFEEVLFRPFVIKNIWLSRIFVDELGAMMQSFRDENRIIAFLSVSSANPAAAMVSDRPVDYGLLKAGNGGTQCLFRYRYSKDGRQVDNITDWALARFQKAYGKNGNLRPNRTTGSSRESPAAKNPPQRLSKDAIFNYVYGVLHDPIYKTEYAADLRKKFPRLPFKEDFWRWADWGAELMALHLGFATANPWPLKRVEKPPTLSLKGGKTPDAILRADRDAGTVRIDSETTLRGIPPEAWQYKLGNRSAVEWVLDQFKERKSRDPVIVQKNFNTYEFADHKEAVIELLGRVTRVSVETVTILEEMAKAGTGP